MPEKSIRYNMDTDFRYIAQNFFELQKLFLFFRKNWKFKLRLFLKIMNDISVGYKTKQHNVN
jgi:hypothetical protein